MSHILHSYVYHTALVESLHSKGVLGAVKAKIRAEIFLALQDEVRVNDLSSTPTRTLATFPLDMHIRK